MADREKLIDLRREGEEIAENFCVSKQECYQCPYNAPNGCKEGLIADHLIASGVTIQRWIPVTERLPEEHDSIFTLFYGTARWQDGMFLKCSDTVLASVEYEDCKRRVKAIITKDGKWDISKMYRASKVTHWMPLPEPPKGE